MKMRYTHLQRTRVSGSAQQEVERLADAVDTLRDEVGLLRDQHLELNERMDFTERLLERPKSADADLDSLPGQQNLVDVRHNLKEFDDLYCGRSDGE